MHWSDYTRFTITLFVLLAPVLQVPLMLSLVGGTNQFVIKRTALVASLAALALLLVAHYGGELILSVLGTSLASFQIGGGLIVLLIGLTLVQGKPLEAPGSKSDESASVSSLPIRVGITPIGIPAVAGAGTVTAVILETHKEYGIGDDFAITLIIIGNILAVWAILSCAPAIGRVLGTSGMLVTQRLVGLINVVMAVEMIASGVNAHISKLS